MTAEWKCLINALVALILFALAMHLLFQESLFLVGKRDPTNGIYFSGESLRLLIVALLCLAAHAGYWSWRLSRPVRVVFDQGYLLPIVLFAAALVSGMFAYQMAERVAVPASHREQANMEKR